MSFLESILIAYVFVGCLYWLWMAVGMVRIMRAVPLLAKLDPPPPDPWPKLSVVIPACNEAETIGPAVATILAQDYPELEIILIDDRSHDATGRIIDAIAAADGRADALHVTDLPAGWLGKVHALHRGVGQCSGQWLLLTDADVHFSPGALRRAVAYAEYRGLDHLAAAPDLWPPNFLLAAAIAMFVRVFCVGMRCWAIENPASRASIGVGAFNLVRRAAFEKTQGFEWLRLEVADDLGLAQMLKGAGARAGLVNGTGLLGVCWYRSVAEMARGAEKAFASVGGCRMSRLLLVGVVALLLELAPLAALLPLDDGGLLPAGLAMIAAGAAAIVVFQRWARGSVLAGLCVPLAVAFNVAILWRAAWLGMRRGGVLWRGTLYPSEILRKGSRVRFP